MDVEDVEEWVVWVKLKAFDAQSMVFEEDRTVGVVLEENPSSLWEVTENTIERKCGVIAPQQSSLAYVCRILFSEEAGIFSGGIFSARLLIAFTASVCLDIHYGGLFFNRGNNQAVWGDACNKKAMHGCPGVKKASVMKTFTCPIGNGGSSCVGKTCDIGLIMWTPKSESLSAPVRFSATLLFLPYEFPLLVASSRKPRYLSSHAVPRRFPEILTVVSEVDDIRQDCGVLVEVTTSVMDYDSCKEDWGNGYGSNEMPTKGVDGNLHGSSIREVILFCFNMSLNDPSLLMALKAQIQIGGTPQVNTFQVTFHYQRAYRVQNHSLDILVSGQDNAGDALLIDVDSNATPTCTYVPRKLSRDELVKLLPEKWITIYEQIHQAPVRSTSAPEFVRHENGLVEIKFSSSQSKSDNVFPTWIHMIIPTD
nr:putative zinc finger, CCHC-type [Tanacetum cinerariifolium]